MRPLTPVGVYRRASAWATTQAMRAAELGEHPDIVGALIAGEPVVITSEALDSLATACERLERVVGLARSCGVSDRELALIADDANAPIREEWSFGVPVDALYPNLP